MTLSLIYKMRDWRAAAEPRKEIIRIGKSSSLVSVIVENKFTFNATINPSLNETEGKQPPESLFIARTLNQIIKDNGVEGPGVSSKSAEEFTTLRLHCWVITEIKVLNSVTLVLARVTRGHDIRWKCDTSTNNESVDEHIG
jgi:hypothetical protein